MENDNKNLEYYTEDSLVKIGGFFAILFFASIPIAILNLYLWESMPLFVVLGIVDLVAIVFTLVNWAKVPEKGELTKLKWEKEVNRNITVLNKLPTSYVETIAKANKMAISSFGPNKNTIGNHFTMVASATAKVYSGRKSGTMKQEEVVLPSRTWKEIESRIKGYSFTVAGISEAGNIMADDAMNKGLDFGIITNSPAHAALYSAMDTHEKMKNVKRAENFTSEKVDNEALSLINDLEELLK